MSGDAKTPPPRAPEVVIDPRTKRPIGDHGTGEQAIEWILRYADFDSRCQTDEFLKAWREGDTFDEWPEFYVWLSKQPSPSTPPSLLVATADANTREALPGLIAGASSHARGSGSGRPLTPADQMVATKEVLPPDLASHFRVDEHGIIWDRATGENVTETLRSRRDAKLEDQP